MLETAYRSSRYDLAALGSAYQPPKQFSRGSWTLVAELPAQSDGHAIRVFECRMPARFFRIESLPARSFDGAPKPGFVLETGTMEGDLVAAMAKAIAEGMLALRLAMEPPYPGEHPRPPGRPTEERRVPYTLSLRASVMSRADAVIAAEGVSRSQWVEALILRALQARGKAT